ncbi:Uncharacterised protein [Actinobacillus equuli]|nr:Uncharacterised protein [Actinobacillus equuli]
MQTHNFGATYQEGIVSAVDPKTHKCGVKFLPLKIWKPHGCLFFLQTQEVTSFTACPMWANWSRCYWTHVAKGLCDWSNL